jgi:hypothetical protein
MRSRKPFPKTGQEAMVPSALGLKNHDENQNHHIEYIKLDIISNH